MKKFMISDALRHGWAKTKEHFPIVIGVLLSYGIISIALSRFDKLSAGHALLGIILFVVTLIISVILRIGLTKFFLDADENKPMYATLFSAQGVFFAYFVAYILLSLATLIGLVLIIVPGVMIAVTYLFAPVLIVDRKMTIQEAFTESAAMSKGSRWDIFALVCVVILINFVGALFVGVGLLVTMPITFFAFIHVYRVLQNKEMPVVTGSGTETPTV